MMTRVSLSTSSHNEQHSAILVSFVHLYPPLALRDCGGVYICWDEHSS